MGGEKDWPRNALQEAGIAKAFSSSVLSLGVYIVLYTIE